VTVLQQLHVWAWDNPHAIRERGYEVRFSVRVWAGIIGHPLTAQRYSALLKTVLPGLLKDVPLAVTQCLWLQHDGAPAHCEEDVLQWLDATVD
jgi:hypothetical protein